MCLREKESCGPRSNKTYVQVVNQARLIGNENETLDQYFARESNSVWLDPGENEYLIEVPKSVYDSIRDGTYPLFHDGYSNLPIWQQETDTSGSAASFGSFEDPEDKNSTFTRDQELPDDRFILRVWDEDPGQDGSAVNIHSEEVDEDRANPGIERYFKLYFADGTEVNRNVQNDKVNVDGRSLSLDWGTSADPALSPGVAKFVIWNEFTGTGAINSDGQYRLLGPNDESGYFWTAYTNHVYMRIS